MTATRIDGKGLADRLRADLAARCAQLSERVGRPPCLVVVLVGEDPASEVYVRNKARACERAGITSRVLERPASTTRTELEELVAQLNADDGVDGILVQLPLPDQIPADAVRSWIDPAKDVDGFHPENQGLLAAGTPRFVPCTPAGCLEMLKDAGVETAGRHAVVLGRSLIVGRPMATLLSTKGVDATVTLCHSRTPDLERHCRRADILVAAAGVPGLVQPGWIQPGAAVLDVGIHRAEDPGSPRGYRLVGDVADGAEAVAGWLSPVPGGVGPMTIAMLLSNTVRAFGLRHRVAAAGDA